MNDPSIVQVTSADERVDVCVIGSTNLDLVATTSRLPLPGETVLGTSYAEHAGGKGLNQAVAARRAGAGVRFISAVGDDDAGRHLLDLIAAEGIDASTIDRVKGPTGRALIGVSADGENSIIVVPGANASVQLTTLPSARVVLAQLEVRIDVVSEAFVEARRKGAITILNPAPAQPLPGNLLAACSVLVPNEHEVELLGGVQRLLAAGVGAVVVTLGAHGADLHTSTKSTHIDAFPVDVVDTTGAGDAFCGALAAQLAAGADLIAALRFATAAGALATTKVGAVPSLATVAEINDLMGQHDAR